MTQKLWKAIKDYIDAAIENHNSIHVEDSIAKRIAGEEVEKLIEGELTQIGEDEDGTPIYENIKQ